jgi:hypothetical protein
MTISIFCDHPKCRRRIAIFNDTHIVNEDERIAIAETLMYLQMFYRHKTQHPLRYTFSRPLGEASASEPIRMMVMIHSKDHPPFIMNHLPSYLLMTSVAAYPRSKSVIVQWGQHVI